MRPLIATNRSSLDGHPSFGFSNRLYRAVWSVAWILLAAWTPPPLHVWRRLVLVAFGASIGGGAKVYGSARIWYPRNLTLGKRAVLGPGVICYSMDQIEVGDRAVVSQRAHLCAGSHDISDADFQLVTAPIRIEANAWVAAEAFIGPGVVVGEGAVIGARAVVFKSAEAMGVYIGNPAKLIKFRRTDCSA